MKLPVVSTQDQIRKHQLRGTKVDSRFISLNNNVMTLYVIMNETPLVIFKAV